MSTNTKKRKWNWKEFFIDCVIFGIAVAISDIYFQDLGFWADVGLTVLIVLALEAVVKKCKELKYNYDTKKNAENERDE